MLKLALFDLRKRRRHHEAAEPQPSAHDDFKPTEPAVLNLELPRGRHVLPPSIAAPSGEAVMPQPGAHMTVAR